MNFVIRLTTLRTKWIFQRGVLLAIAELPKPTTAMIATSFSKGGPKGIQQDPIT